MFEIGARGVMWYSPTHILCAVLLAIYFRASILILVAFCCYLGDDGYTGKSFSVSALAITNQLFRPIYFLCEVFIGEQNNNETPSGGWFAGFLIVFESLYKSAVAVCGSSTLCYFKGPGTFRRCWLEKGNFQLL